MSFMGLAANEWPIIQSKINDCAMGTSLTKVQLIVLVTECKRKEGTSFVAHLNLAYFIAHLSDVSRY